MKQKTHRLVKSPQISVPLLADYMAASEQRKRSIVKGCKYRSTARIIQHKEARAVASNFIRSGSQEISKLYAKAAAIEQKLADDEFDAKTNQYNADYIRAFADVFVSIDLPAVEFLPPQGSQAMHLEGVKVTHSPNLLTRRLTKTNKLRIGAVALRYAKGKECDPEAAMHHSAAAFGFVKSIQEEQGAEAEKALCLTIDAFSGLVVPAPGNSVYLFNEMKAACASIAERWHAIKPPKNAVL